MAETLTRAMYIALSAAAEHKHGKLPIDAHYNTKMALWRMKAVDGFDFITPYGRGVLADELKKHRHSR